MVSRSMSRKVRSSRAGVAAQEHGFAGRCFSLLRRRCGESVTRASCRQAVCVDSPSLVQFWSVETPLAGAGAGARASKKRRCASASAADAAESGDGCGGRSPSGTVSGSGSLSEAGSSRGLVTPDASWAELEEAGPLPLRGGSVIQCLQERSGAHAQVVVRGDLTVEGDACFRGDLRVRSLHVQGSLTVEGGINGQLVTPPEAADYAEWFGKVDPAERIEAGDVVQLQSPAQKVSKRTDGEGPILVVSTKPSVAAGVPFGARPEQGCLLAFLGQVPVRVMGPVSVGDLLVPSGLSDGMAVRARHGLKKGDAQDQHEPLGTAMEACGTGRHTVLSFVRWAHNSKWAGIQQSDAHARSTIQRVWFGTHRGWGPFALGALGALALGAYTPSFCPAYLRYTPSFCPAYLRGLLLGDLASVLWAVLHAPDYVELVFEVHLFYALARHRGLGARVAGQLVLVLDARARAAAPHVAHRARQHQLRDRAGPCAACAGRGPRPGVGQRRRGHRAPHLVGAARALPGLLACRPRR